MKAIAELNDNETGASSEFVIGETPLNAMAKQLDNIDESNIYLADGLIKLFGLKELEILLLETSNNFGSTDNVKISFDHQKGLFGSLAMIKTVADSYCHGSLETFAKVKIFFLQGAGKRLLLWSIKYVHEGPGYELWLERVVEVNIMFAEQAEALPILVSFF